MFVLTTLVYPVVLALLCVGAGSLVDRASGGVLPAMLFPAVGAAALIVASQLSTYVAPLAPSTPYLLVALAAAGVVVGWDRLRALGGAWRVAMWQLVVLPLAYLLALAPVLGAGRPTFSSYMALADSAVHMLGADYLIRHGQDYSHLDLHNSYGAFIHAYYDSSYPSGADTLLGGSARLLGMSLTWAFQPFTAFMLATAAGPAWVLARRVGLERAWGALAALTIALPALVYAYELIGSVKEIVALPLILTLGALVVEHRRWLWGGARGAIPFALTVAAGVAALGVAFGAWALAAALVLAIVALTPLVRGMRRMGMRTVGEGSAFDAAPRARVGQPFLEHLPQPPEPASGVPAVSRRVAAMVALGGLVLLVAAWPTWADLSGSLHVARAIASTSNPGNLHSSLRPAQLFGVWLGGSYKLVPTGVALTLTSVLVAFVFALAILGLGRAVRSGWYALAGWFALMLVIWLVLVNNATTWADAKTLMLTSPAVLLMAWAGIAALRASPLRLGAPLVAFVLVGGVLVSDALQYHESNLAPTARYEELASVNKRFAGRGPALFADFDEYALYELRDLDIDGPDFAYPTPPLSGASGGHGRPVTLDGVAPAKLLAYPLIVTRRDPTATRPPTAYRLLWQGTYYQVWGRRPGARTARIHVVMSAPPALPRARCLHVAKRLGGWARDSRVGRLFAALAPQLVTVPLPRLRFFRPPGWARTRSGILMHRPGTLRIAFRLPHGGVWRLWLKGEVMRALSVAVDGRPLGSLGAQLGDNSLVANTLSPLGARLSAGSHVLTITRPGTNLAPGDGGAALLSAIFLTPAGPAGEPALHAVPAARLRRLCARPLQWVELVPRR
jgi:hypothetical protein